MSSQTDQSVKKKKKKSKRYDHNAPPPPPPEHSRQHFVAGEAAGKRIDIDYQKLERYMWTNPTLEFTALFFGVSGDTIENIIRERYALSFSEFREKNLCVTRHALVQKAMQRALEHDSDRMLSLALANIVGWTDNVQVQVKPQQAIQLRYSLDAPPEIPDMKDVTPIEATAEKK